MSEILIFPNFIDEATCQSMNDWVNEGVENKWLDKSVNSQGDNWSYEKRLTSRGYSERYEYSEIIYKVFEKITDFLKLGDLNKSTYGGGKNGLVVSYLKDGGELFKHCDPKEGALEVLRCNIMTQAADQGADLYIGGKKIDIGVGDLHCYLPSTVEHYVTQASGKERIMWMFGYQCSIPRFEELITQQGIQNVYQ